MLRLLRRRCRPLAEVRLGGRRPRRPQRLSKGRLLRLRGRQEMSRGRLRRRVAAQSMRVSNKSFSRVTEIGRRADCERDRIAKIGLLPKRPVSLLNTSSPPPTRPSDEDDDLEYVENPFEEHK